MHDSPPDFSAARDAFRDFAAATGQDKLSFILVGRTGVGKSSVINQLLGMTLAKEGDFEPTTFEVNTYRGERHGFSFQVTDTPGLCDDLPAAGNDDRYLDLLCAANPQTDCLLYVSRLDENRVTPDEKRAIHLLSERFGSDIWQRCVLVFTHAGNVPAARYPEFLATRSRLLREEIGKHFAGAAAIPACATEKTHPLLPNGKAWLPELFVTVAERCPHLAGASFILSQAERTRGPSGSKEKAEIPLDPAQQRRLAERLKSAFSGALTGAGIGGKIGGVFGPKGRALGKVLGAVAGALIGFFS